MSAPNVLEDEEEAEQFLDRLDWDSNANESCSIPAYLQKRLNGETSALNVEIIDFLLQWEEEEDQESDFITVQKPKDSQSHDTADVLLALRKIDDELAQVEDWLGTQIDTLSGIQSELYQIETENNALESSWQNLSTLKAITEAIINVFSLSINEEDILRSPQRSFESALHQATLDDVDTYIGPLADAISRLHTGLSMKGTDLKLESSTKQTTTFHMSESQWAHIQSMVCVSQQRLHLMSIAETFCRNMSVMNGTFFKNLLKHRSLLDTSRSRSITVAKFALTCPTDLFIALDSASHPQPAQQQSSQGNNEPIGSTPRSRNQFLEAQRVYQESLSAFLPVLSGYMEILPLVPGASASVSDATLTLRIQYVDSARDLLYTPLFRQLCRDVSSAITAQARAPQPCGMALSSLPRASLAGANEGLLLLSHIPIRTPPARTDKKAALVTDATVTPLTVWQALAAALNVCLPVLRREEDFLEAFFFSSDATTEPSAEGTKGAGVGNGVGISPMHTSVSALGVMFDGLMEQLLSQATTAHAAGGETGVGLEVVAMLAVLEEIIKTETKATTESLADGILGDDRKDGGPGVAAEVEVDFVCRSLARLKEWLLTRLDAFAASQVVWVRQPRPDPKRAGVLPPVSRLGSFVDQTLVLAGRSTQIPAHVDRLLETVSLAVVDFVEDVACSNAKYGDVVRFQNFSFLVVSLQCRNVTAPSLLHVLDQSRDALQSAESRYLQAMLSQELSKQFELSQRIDALSRRVGREELGLYILRQDVMSVCKLLDSKVLEAAVGNMRRRLEKHLGGPPSADGQELRLVERTWEKLKEQAIAIVSNVQQIASSVYQISVSVTVDDLNLMFDKAII